MGHALSEEHILLFIDMYEGTPRREPVHVRRLGDGRFELLYSPGFVQDLAAGDVFEVVDEIGRVRVLARGGNLAVQVYANEPVAVLQVELSAAVARLGGKLDGAIDHGLVYTIPSSAGFPAVEALFVGWVAAHPGWSWFYGNVYDLVSGAPLNWWLTPSRTDI